MNYTGEKIQLRRQGTSKNVNGHLPGGDRIEIYYHNIHKNFQVKIERTETKSGITTTIPVHTVKAVETLSEAIAQIEKKFNVLFDPEIEAYCYSGSKTLEIWPHLRNDVYITCATYEPGTDSIRHEPSNICLIVFGNEENGPAAQQYTEDPANQNYTVLVQKAIESYNSNVGAHGRGVERKEWLAWLIGQYIKEIPGEKPIRTQSISRTANKNRKDSE